MIVFARNQDNKEVHVDSVPNGKDCQCFCKGCGQPLIAANRGEIRLHHFKHIEDQNFKRECDYNDSEETQLHYHSKDIIFKEKKVMTCSCEYVDDYGQHFPLKNAELLSFKTVEIEKRIEIDGHTREVDLYCVTEDNQEICIEINYSNRVKGEKFFNIQNLKKYTFLEIDVYKQKLEDESDKVKLKEFLINNSEERRWLFHPLIEKKKQEERERIEEERKREQEEFKKRLDEKIEWEREEYKRKQEERNRKNKEEVEQIQKQREEVSNNLKKESSQVKILEKPLVFQELPSFTSPLPIPQSFINDLNDSQRKAVEYCDGPQLVIAGAGSGKTRVLTYKIAYLLAQGMKPWNILALTFTNKAANEMKERIGQLVGQDAASRLQMGTFHSVFSRILRVEAGLLGFNSNFTIYDEADSRSLLKTIAKEMGLDEKQYKPATVHHHISMAKNHLISAAEYANDYEVQRRDQDAKLPEIGRIFVEYEQRCRQANAMDFDDLLVMTFRLFRDHEDILQKYCQRFQYVLVDEYQDTNYAQQQIVLQLTREHRRICVVGDDAQSIYAFRGANIDNILAFQKVYPESKLFKLEQNYRSTQRIVQAANSLIKKNERQIPKEVFSHNDEGEPLVLKQAYSDKEEASIICQEIKRIRRADGCEYNDFAILYRTNAQSRTFEEEMRRQNIPYRIYGGLSFYQRKEIKDIIAYFRLVCNPSDEEAIKRIINYPSRGIGNTTIQKISDAARSRGTSFWEVVAHPVESGLDVTKGTMQKLAEFVAMIGGFIGKLTSADAHELGREIVQKSGISTDLFAGNDPEQLSRQQNLEEFLNGLGDFVDTRREEGREREVFLPDFLQEVSLLTDLDSDDGNESRVLLMTIHAAKGLEFPTVFIVGMEESIFPSQMATTMRELEEERRLFYVAVTRAEKHCILTCAKSRWRYGKMEFSNPSRFLKDIDPKFVRVEGESSSSFGGQRFGGSFSDQFGGSFRRMQNSRPVASQFMADRQLKITSPRRPESPIEPFSDSFKQKLAAASIGRNLRRIPSSSSTFQKTSNPSVSSASTCPLKIGNVIEHQRFGIGTVTNIEGTGDETKATVDFRHVGPKQLLIKYARFTIVK